MNRFGLTPSEVYFIKDLAWKAAMGLVILLIVAWLAPHLWNVYGLRPDDCVDWQNSNPTISYVEAYPCDSPLPFKPVEP